MQGVINAFNVLSIINIHTQDLKLTLLARLINYPDRPMPVPSLLRY
jgi:hypothetical protein